MRFAFTLLRNKTVIISDWMLPDQRHIYLSSDISCKLLLELNPYGRIYTLTPIQSKTGSCTINDYYKGDMTCSLTESETLYLVIYGEMYKTWKEANEICESVGASLPSVTSYTENQMLEALILRSYKGVKIASHAQCRFFSPSCGVYLGLENIKVCLNF